MLVLALIGCTAKPPDSRLGAVSDQVPGRWAATKEARVGIDTRWVSRIGGGRVASFVDEALSANADMRIAAERVNRAVAAAKKAGAKFKPKVSAGLTGDRSQRVFVGFPFGGDEAGSPGGGGTPGGGGGVPSSLSETYGANLTVAWEPDIWGFHRAGQSALIAEAQAEGQAYRAARASLAAQVLRAWLAVAEANEQITLAEAGQELRQTTLSIVKDRFDNALTAEGGSVSEFRLAEREVATGKATLIQRQSEREEAIRQLELLMARYPKGALKSADRLPALPPAPPVGLPSELLLRRPDILEAERRFAASGQLKEQGRLAFYPRFNLTASGGTSSNQLKRLVDSDFGVWSLAGSITYPIWSGGGELRAEYQRLASQDREELAKMQKAVLRAFGEVEQALIADRFLSERYRATDKASDAAVEAAKASRSDYANGIGDAISLINAESTRISIASQLVSLKRLQLDNRITLHLALGGDYRVGK